MTARLLPFIAAFAVFVVVFLALDFVILKLHGLALVYTP